MSEITLEGVEEHIRREDERESNPSTYGKRLPREMVDWLIQRVKDLEGELKKGTCCNALCYAEKLQVEARVKELEEGIEQQDTEIYQKLRK